MLWLDMGLGKTVITLTSIKERMDRVQVFGSLILAPLRVCHTVWEQEARKWEHTRHLTFSHVTGDTTDRLRGMMRRADIYLLNYENIPWFVNEIESRFLSRGLYPYFNNIVFDEVSKMKDSAGVRSTRLRRILPYIPYRTGLTGTPAPNGYKDLHGQYRVIDDGARLGANKTDFMEDWFHKKKDSQFDIELNEGADYYLKRRIADITLEMAAEDYIDMPDIVFNDIIVELDAKTRQKYEQLERELFIELDSGRDIEVFNEASKYNKCLQAANGALYIEPGCPEWDWLHDAKLDALDDIIEEAGGQPILIFYEFQHDVARIKARHPDAYFVGDYKTKSQAEWLQNEWNAGRVSKLIGHPASMGHGLNLQYGGHIGVWFGLNWSLDLYLQAIARLARQGQKYIVMMHRILAHNTLDYAVREALENKANTQTDLRQSIKNYRASKSL